MAKLIFIAAIAIAATALLVAGCGGGDSSLSRAELLKEADKICANVTEQNFKRFQLLVAENATAFAKSPSSPAALAVLGEGVATITVPVLRQATEELESLDASSEEKEDVEALTAAMKDATKAAEDNPDSPRATGGLLYSEVRKQAGEGGFKKCMNMP